MQPTMLGLIACAYWLALPVATAGVLHMVAVKRDIWPSLKVAIDGGRRFRGQRLFGKNKTWRGVVFMVAVSGSVGAIQGALGGEWAAARGVELLEYASIGGSVGGGTVVGYMLVNAVFGLAYVLGELPNSFAKRQMGLEPGQRASGTFGLISVFVDRIDSVSAVIVAMLAFGVEPVAAAVAFGCFIALHLALNVAMVALGVRRSL